MNSILVKEVKYERPRGTSTSEAQEQLRQNVQWEFIAELDSDLPHGQRTFGGLLRRADGPALGRAVWQARHYSNTPWGPTSYTREGAVANIIPKVIDVMTEWINVRRQQAEEWERRLELRREIAAHFTANFKISVSGGPDAPVNTPLSFHITISDLDETAIRTLAAQVNYDAGKRCTDLN